MGRGKNQHVVSIGKKWGILGYGNYKYTIKNRTKKEAIEIAKKIAKNQKSEVIIHSKGGKIAGKFNYSKSLKSFKH